MRAGGLNCGGVEGRRLRRFSLFLKVFLISLLLSEGVFCYFLGGAAWLEFLLPEREVKSVHLSAPENVFRDVLPNGVEAGAVEMLTKGGIISGFSDGTFRPNDKIKREEFIKMVVKALKVNPHPLSNSNCFSDVGSEWFAPFACFAKKRNYITGYEDGSFGVGKNITVQEAVSLLSKVFGSDAKLITAQADDDLSRGQAATLLAKAMGRMR